MKIRQPHAGDRYIVRKGFEVVALFAWAAPFTGGGRCILPAGEVFRVEIDPQEGASGVVCKPERYAALQEHFVPQETIDAPGYVGYSIVVLLDDMARNCELVE